MVSKGEGKGGGRRERERGKHRFLINMRKEIFFVQEDTSSFVILKKKKKNLSRIMINRFSLPEGGKGVRHTRV